jgi:hypothetical protein
LNGLKARDHLLLFPSIPIGVILEGEFAISFADIFDGGSGGEVEILVVCERREKRWSA